MTTSTRKYTLHVHGMHCHACVLMTESELGDLPNVTHVKSSLKHHSVEIIGDFGDKSPEQIAEESCKVVREKIVAETDRAPCEQFHEMLKVRDPMISRIFNQTWFGMPESAEVRIE
jgi:cation transport ATPase